MKRVLIVDDDRATSAGMADVVEEWGYEAEAADTVKAGWASVSKLVPDVAIVDLKLPDGTGLDLLHRVKETYPDVSVIILTGHRSEEHTSELQSPMYLVCRLLLEKKKKQ